MKNINFAILTSIFSSNLLVVTGIITSKTSSSIKDHRLRQYDGVRPGVIKMQSESDNTLNKLDNTYKSKLLTACLSLSYTSIVVDVMTLPPCLALVQSEFGLFATSFPMFNFKSMMFIATLATMLGKFFLGPPTDYYGGELTMKATMLSMGILLLLCSISTNLLQFGPLWIILSFVYASAWGACGKVVRTRYPALSWGAQLGSISGTSRLGSMLASLLFGSVLASKGIATSSSSLHKYGNWRQVFRVGAIIQMIIFAAYTLIDKYVLSDDTNKDNTLSNFDESSSSSSSSSSSRRGEITKANNYEDKTPVNRSDENLTKTQSSNNRDNNNNNNNNNSNMEINEENETVTQVLKRVFTLPSFWLMLLGKMNLLMVGQFISFIPSYLTTSTHLKVSPALAAKISARFALGSFISSMLGTKYYGQLSSVQKNVVVTLLNIVGTMIPLALTLPQFAQQQYMSWILGVWGVCWAMPFFIPPGLFVLSLSRPHAALLTNIYDAVGFTLAAIFSYLAVKCGELGNWNKALYSLSFGTLLAMFGMNIAMQWGTTTTTTTKSNKVIKKE